MVFIGDLFSPTPAPSPSSSSLPTPSLSDVIGHPLFLSVLKAYQEASRVGIRGWEQDDALFNKFELFKLERKVSCSKIGQNPELDEFMFKYLDLMKLHKDEIEQIFVAANRVCSVARLQANSAASLAPLL
eukprot:GILI01020843.1.p1 GENE.GILI01020843.1~~GILI01020843.1.p1  ORF type:complete len:130 (-),score=30.23 GILI01020843.1:52-441(-)